VTLEVPELPLIKGEFTVYIFLLDEEGLHVYDTKIMQDAFEMEQDGYEVGLIGVEHGWFSARTYV
jgi:lipopolysaccharide transport system ATP-binding protein